MRTLHDLADRLELISKELDGYYDDVSCYRYVTEKEVHYPSEGIAGAIDELSDAMGIIRKYADEGDLL